MKHSPSAAWIRKILGRKKVTVKSVESEPIKSDSVSAPAKLEVDVASDEPEYITPNGPFFRLPTELRIQIIAAAFDNITVDVITFFNEPETRGSSTSTTGEDRCWTGCVCYREVADHEWWWRGDPGPRDKCPAEAIYDWHHWHGETPRSWALGIIGWMVSCRQAYAETMNVLYDAESFNLEDCQYVFQCPPPDWPPPPPSRKPIKYVDFRHSPGASRQRVELGLAPLRYPPPALPKVRVLRLSIGGEKTMPCGHRMTYDVARDWNRRCVFRAVDSFAMAAGSRLAELHVALPSLNTFDCWCEGEDVVPYGSGATVAFWRPVDAGPQGLAGYWVVRGAKRLPNSRSRRRPSGGPGPLYVHFASMRLAREGL